jgi:hypothetical protein
MFEFISKKISDIKILHGGYTADYFLNRMKPNALFPILFIQNNLLKKKKKSGFLVLIGQYIFVTQLVAKHMKEIINLKFSKNSGMIVYHSRTVCKNLKIFNKTGKDFVLIQ